MPNDDLDNLSAPGAAQHPQRRLEQRTEEKIQLLRPGEIPDFTEERKDIEDGDSIVSVTVKKVYVTSDGAVLRGPQDYVGVCYATATSSASIVPGCGILTEKRQCAEPLCGRLLCAKHSHPHPTQDGLLLCDEHFQEEVCKQRIQTVGAILYWGFIVLAIAVPLFLAIQWIAKRFTP